MVTRVAAALAVIAVASTARADSPKLAEAKRAVDEVRFDDARRLLVEAVNEGSNSPAALGQIYELSASTAIVLNQRELAEQYYRRWLALEPAAKLAEGVSPKLAEAFVAAQAYMAAHGKLVVRADRRSPTEIDVTAVSDPLAMATAAVIDLAGSEPATFDAEHRARVVTPASSDARVLVLDEHGNHVAELVAAPFVETRQPDRVPEQPEETRPFSRRWTTWGVPAAAFLVAGAVFGTIALDEQHELDDAIGHSGQHFFGDVDGDHKTIRRNATIGIALGSVGVLLGIPAAIFYAKARRPWTLGPLSIAPVAHPSGVGVAGTF
jgi:hypothetical protein